MAQSFTENAFECPEVLVSPAIRALYLKTGARKHDSLGEIIWLIGGEECSGSCRGKDTGRLSSSKVMCGYCRGHMKFT